MVKISALPPESTPTLTDSVPIYDPESGITKKTTLANVGVALGSGSSWLTLGYAPNTVTANGNRSYTLVFNSINLTGGTSPGQRLLLPRTVTAPTECADLEASSSQYFNDTTVSGMTFTDDFVVSAWVKLESYPSGSSMVLVSRYNGTSGWDVSIDSQGRLVSYGYNGGASNLSGHFSYQSVPLNKWVHIAVQVDMSSFTSTTTTNYVMFDGVDVPTQSFRSGTNPTALVQAGNLEVGSRNGGLLPFDGKIAQVAIYSAKVTQATIRASMNQTLTGSETSLVSAYTLSNSLNDLNTTNANNLTAQNSAVATNADTPFTNSVTGTSVTAGTTNYGIIMAQTFSTNTTYTIQVPEGETLPTTGGIGTVSYSTQKTPYGFPGQSTKWRISSSLRTDSSTTSNATFGAFISNGWALTVPVGGWVIGWKGTVYNTNTANVTFNISSSALTGLTEVTGSNASPYSYFVLSPAGGNTSCVHISQPQDITVLSTYVMYTIGATTAGQIKGTVSTAEIFAENAYL